MLSQEITELARRIIAGKLYDLQEKLQQDISRILAEAAQQGLATSGVTLGRIRDRCVVEVEERADVVWQALRQVIEAAGVPSSEKLASDLKAEVEYHLRCFTPDLIGILYKKAENMGLANTAAGRDLTQENTLWSTLEHVLARIGTEVDLYLLSLRNPEHGNPSQAEKEKMATGSSRRIFIGHGRSDAWRTLKDFIQDRLRLDWEEFNRESPAGLTTVQRLEQMLSHASFAFLVMTAEDEHPDGTKHARENVIHEAGLFQGRLGFERAIILLEEGCTEFSNIHGLTQIRFPPGDIMAKSEEIRRVLEREGILRKD